MTTSLKAILSAVSIAALLASPAIAKTRYYNSPYYGGAGAYYGYGGSYIGGGPYSPASPTPRYGPSRDFQTGGLRY